MDSEKKIIGRCPFCGGNVVKTCKGYRCENNTGEHPSCVLNINAIIGNRKMNDGEIAEFLEKRRILLDGFSTKEGKTFPTVLELADDGAVNMQSVIGRCPHCGGEVRVGTRAFRCGQYAVCNRQVSALRRRGTCGNKGFQLLQLQQSGNTVLIRHMEEYRRPSADTGRGERAL